MDVNDQFDDDPEDDEDSAPTLDFVGTTKSPAHVCDAKRPGKAKKQVTSLRHLQSYLNDNHQHHSDIGLNESSIAEELPYEVICNDKFVGWYVNWLSRDAKKFDGSGLLAYKTAIGYASSFMEFYRSKYREKYVFSIAFYVPCLAIIELTSQYYFIFSDKPHS